jgi:hypothetical protein
MQPAEQQQPMFIGTQIMYPLILLLLPLALLQGNGGMTLVVPYQGGILLLACHSKWTACLTIAGRRRMHLDKLLIRHKGF